MTSRPHNRLIAPLSRLGLMLLRSVKQGVEKAWPTIARSASFTGRLLARIFILPIYRLFMLGRLRYRRLTLPSRGALLFLTTNRYLFHVVVIGVSVATIGVNIAGRQVNAQDAGQQSILYAMVTDEESRSTEQQVSPDLLVHDSSYAGPSSLLAVPNIDFDYDETDQPPVTAIAVPGTLVAAPVSHAPNEPAGPAYQRTKTETYVVQAGDTLSTIAQRFGVNVGTLLWSNARSATAYLRPGDVLKIPPVSGVLVTVKKGDTLLSLANKYGGNADEIATANLLADNRLTVGAEIVIPGGHPPAAVPTVVARNTAPTRLEHIPPSPTRKPPAADTSKLPGTKLLWPTNGRSVTQYYGWRHTGIDIDGDYTSPIYAAQDGRIIAAGWNKSGYGLMLLVEGENGVTTRYAHASKLFVKIGDVVKKGETMAMVGTTGRSTGTHLHFEVYINGKRMNPLAYIK